MFMDCPRSVCPITVEGEGYLPASQRRYSKCIPACCRLIHSTLIQAASLPSLLRMLWQFRSRRNNVCKRTYSSSSDLNPLLLVSYRPGCLARTFGGNCSRMMLIARLCSYRCKILLKLRHTRRTVLRQPGV
jgi:hypothetical protein